MNPFLRGILRLMMAAGAGLWLVRSTVAVLPPDSSPPDDKEFTLPAVQPPASGVVRSPVQLFRELLALTPAEQREFLADRSPEQQRRILAKLREYESLRPNQRELRLRATELRWYLWPLLTTPATNRTLQLNAVPDEHRKLIEDRLREWDKTPAAAQKDLLDNAATLRYFTQVEPVTEAQKQAVLSSLSPARREKLQAGISRWQALSESQRRKTLDRFNKFFELTPGEKEKALGKLSDEERRQMEKTLKKFEALPADQRMKCVNAFAQFASLSLQERQQFLKNAERWRLMSPDERQNWRELVLKLPAAGGPPMPPGLPELPVSAVATNNRK